MSRLHPYSTIPTETEEGWGVRMRLEAFVDSVDWPKVSFGILGVLYLGGGLLLAQPMVETATEFHFPSSPRCNYTVQRALEKLGMLSLMGIPLAMIAGGVGIHFSCWRSPVNLNGLAWSSLLPIGYVVLTGIYSIAVFMSFFTVQ